MFACAINKKKIKMLLFITATFQMCSSGLSHVCSMTVWYNSASSSHGTQEHSAL